MVPRLPPPSPQPSPAAPPGPPGPSARPAAGGPLVEGRPLGGATDPTGAAPASRPRPAPGPGPSAAGERGPSPSPSPPAGGATAAGPRSASPSFSLAAGPVAPAPASASAGAEPSALATSQSTGGGLGPVAAAPMRLQDDATVGEALAGYTAYLGGSFDPGHYGHVAGGVALLRHGADALWLAPTHVHADKCNSCPFDLRLAQCRAVADEIDSRLPQRLRGRVHVTDVEARVDSGGQTSRLFAHLTAAHPRRKFAFAMGSDCLAQAPGWDGWDALQRLVRVVVLDRPGYAADHRDLLGDPMPEVSSTAIRRALGAGVRPSALGDLMPPGVAALVDSCNLYGAMQRAGVPADAASTEAKRSHLHGEKSNVDAGPTPSASVASAPAGAPGAAPARAPAQASDRVASKPATPEAAVAAAPPGSGRVGGRIL